MINLHDCLFCNGLLRFARGSLQFKSGFAKDICYQTNLYTKSGSSFEDDQEINYFFIDTKSFQSKESLEFHQCLQRLFLLPYQHPPHTFRDAWVPFKIELSFLNILADNWAIGKLRDPPSTYQDITLSPASS